MEAQVDRQEKHIEINNSIENLYRVTAQLDSLIAKIGGEPMSEAKDSASREPLGLQSLLDGASSRIEASIECHMKKISEIENMIF